MCDGISKAVSDVNKFLVLVDVVDDLDTKTKCVVLPVDLISSCFAEEILSNWNNQCKASYM